MASAHLSEARAFEDAEFLKPTRATVNPPPWLISVTEQVLFHGQEVTED
jgi:hypothetical protein